jgi:hypothetical protein
LPRPFISARIILLSCSPREPVDAVAVTTGRRRPWPARVRQWYASGAGHCCSSLVCAGFVYAHRGVWFQMTPEDACRFIYGRNGFVESVEIGRYIKEHSAPDARVAVIGSEPQIYFYAHRHSASGFIYMYDLVQLHRYAASSSGT